MLSRELIMEVSDLAMRAGDERLSTAQRNRLSELLESEDDACRALLFCGIMEAELAVYSREEAAQDRALEAITSNASVDRWASPTRKRPRRSDSRFSRWFFRAAVICLVSCAAIPFLNHEKKGSTAPSAPVANLAKRVPQTVGSLKSAPD